jgi:hypothetical protein
MVALGSNPVIRFSLLVVKLDHAGCITSGPPWYQQSIKLEALL